MGVGELGAPQATPGTRLPVGWESSYTGATPVIVEAVNPSAVSSPEVALVGVQLFGNGLIVVLLVLLLLRRNTASR